jgi:actin-related protein 8
MNSPPLKQLLNVLRLTRQEALAALFDSGSTCACVVNVGTHSTIVCCVDEGVVLPYSRILLPYGE